MQANNSSIVDLLRSKDEKVDYPAEWDWVKANKNQYLLKLEE
jgi:hypothetical protein